MASYSENTHICIGYHVGCGGSVIFKHNRKYFQDEQISEEASYRCSVCGKFSEDADVPAWVEIPEIKT